MDGRRATSVLATTLLALVAMLSVAPQSQADRPSPCSHYGLKVGCQLQIGDSDGGSDGGGGDDGPKIPLCHTRPGLEPVACSTEEGPWSNQHQCYLIQDTTAAPDDPLWKDSNHGGIYDCVGRDGTQKGRIWLEEPPILEGQNRGSVIGNILNMNFAAFYIGMAPSARDDKRNAGLVGMPVWMYAAGLHAGTGWQYYEPPGETARDPLTGYYVRAWTKKTEWHMGDGTVVTCDRGTPYFPAMGMRTSPDCGHKYTKPGYYRVTVKTIWGTEWLDADSGGVPQTEDIVFERSAVVRIFENQVVAK